MVREAHAVTRRGVLVAVGSALVLSLLGCVERAEDPEPSPAASHDVPKTVDGVLESAELAPLPEGAQVQLLESATITEFEAWAIEVRLEASADDLEHWMVDSFGDPEGPGRAWVTPQKVKEAMGIEDVPDTWRIDEASVQGSPYERMVLIDDADPRTVRVRLSEVR